jgi:hypothetical protein
MKIHKKTNCILRIAALAICFQLTISCGNFKSIKGSGNVVSTDRHLTGFNAITTCCGIDVIITQGDTESVKVEVDDNLQQYIKTVLHNQMLNISVDSASIQSKHIKVHVKVKKIIMIDASSGSVVETTNPLLSDSIKLISSSGADIKMNMVAKYVSCETSSGSDAILKGQTDRLTLDVSSGADVKAQDLTAETCKATATSGSTIKVKVTKEISAEASSGAGIHVWGNPQVRNVDKSSGGSISFE